jgi:RNA polymerase sigma-70 factor (ECF subfamily)
MEQLTDKSLLLKLREGNHVAFRRLFQKYYQRLFLFACKFVDEDIAKDLVQDCFLELWKNRNKVRTPDLVQQK